MLRAGGLLLLLIAACTSEAAGPKVVAGQAFGTIYNVQFFSDVEAGAVQLRIASIVRAWNGIFSMYEPSSEISRFNAQRSTEKFNASAEFDSVLSQALQMAKWTDGALDPTVAPLLRLYGFGSGAPNLETPPTADVIRGTMTRVGHDKLVRVEGGFRKRHPDLELDLNAIAKGAGVDRIAAVLRELGIQDYMVNIGGEVACRGSKPGGQPWVLGIRDPGSDSYLKTVPLRDECMATSGNYEQVRNLDGKRVHHILDPRTGKNVESQVVSVTVVGSSCALADGLATALMVIGPDGAEAVLARYPGKGLRAWFLLRGENDRLGQRGVLWK